MLETRVAFFGLRSLADTRATEKSSQENQCAGACTVQPFATAQEFGLAQGLHAAFKAERSQAGGSTPDEAESSIESLAGVPARPSPRGDLSCARWLAQYLPGPEGTV